MIQNEKIRMGFHDNHYLHLIRLSFRMKIAAFVVSVFCFFPLSNDILGQDLKLNELGYFEKPGVNVLVFSSEYNGMFFDENEKLSKADT